jgi:hypothetical protein
MRPNCAGASFFATRADLNAAISTRLAPSSNTLGPSLCRGALVRVATEAALLALREEDYVDRPRDQDGHPEVPNEQPHRIPPHGRHRSNVSLRQTYNETVVPSPPAASHGCRSIARLPKVVIAMAIRMSPLGQGPKV